MFVSGNQLCDLTRSEGYIQMNCLRKQICLKVEPQDRVRQRVWKQWPSINFTSKISHVVLQTLQLHHKSHCPDHHDLSWPHTAPVIKSCLRTPSTDKPTTMAAIYSNNNVQMEKLLDKHKTTALFQNLVSCPAGYCLGNIISLIKIHKIQITMDFNRVSMLLN